MTAFEQLLERVNEMPILDTHEHLDAREPEEWGDIDVISGLLAAQYAHTTMAIAGIRRDWQAKEPILDKWRALAPYWEDCRYMGYMQGSQIAVRDLFGFDKINEKNIEALNDAFLESLRPGCYGEMLLEKSRIITAIVDADFDCDRRFFRSVFHVDKYVMPAFEHDMWIIEKETGVTLRTFDDWLYAFEADLKNGMAKGIVALKCALAYQRPLKFERVTYSEAEADFNEMYRHRFRPGHVILNHGAGRAFQDYMMHYICKTSEKLGLTLQVHTGLLEGITNHLPNANPELLNNLFVEYPDLEFDLFHISYPYHGIAGALAKMFPNVYVDMCWAHIISPEASINALDEWIGLLPLRKISAFGGDFNGNVPHLVYGHAMLARRNVCKALARKIADGLMDADEAYEVAKKLFIYNPVRLFGLEKDAAVVQALKNL